MVVWWTFPPLYIGRVHLLLKDIRCNFLGLFGSGQTFLLANGGDPDQMPHYVASDLGLHCLPMYPLLGFPDNNGLIFLLTYNFNAISEKVHFIKNARVNFDFTSSVIKKMLTMC